MKTDFSKKDLGILLKTYKYWSMYLSPKQYYLGKIRLVLKRKGVIDFCDLSESEYEELFKIIAISKKALSKCFNPDLFNYATLGNCIRHHHWHIIPRYKTVRVVGGVKFKDENWNHEPWPYSQKSISTETINEIHKMIQKEI